MHVSNSHPKRVVMAPTPVAEPPPAGTPELPVGATLAGSGCLARSGQSAYYFAEPSSLVPTSGSMDEAEARLILETRHQEYVARRGLEEIFSSGAAEFLSI
jgi:hypothetical protein